MAEKAPGELSPEDFGSLMLDFVEREAATDDMLSDDVFFLMLAKIATRRVVEVIDLGRVFASRLFAEADRSKSSVDYWLVSPLCNAHPQNPTHRIAHLHQSPSLSAFVTGQQR